MFQTRVNLTITHTKQRGTYFLEGRPYRKEYLIAYKGRLAGAGAYYKTRQ
jgi:hypothetical protein